MRMESRRVTVEVSVDGSDQPIVMPAIFRSRREVLDGERFGPEQGRVDLFAWMPTTIQRQQADLSAVIVDTDHRFRVTATSPMSFQIVGLQHVG